MYKSGDWLALCDVCQHRYYASELRKRWDGYMVCKHDWEPRHPLDFLKVKPEHNFPSFIRTETDPEITITSTPESVQITLTDENGDPVAGVQPSVGNTYPHIISIDTPTVSDAYGNSYITITPVSVGTGMFHIYYGGVYSNTLTFIVEGT
jgi:hypothetical protein